jgi:hypothetical protein
VSEVEHFEAGKKVGEALALTRALEVVTLVTTGLVKKWGEAEVMTRAEAFATGRMNGSARVQAALTALAGGASVERSVEIALEEKTTCAAS